MEFSALTAKYLTQTFTGPDGGVISGESCLLYKVCAVRIDVRLSTDENFFALDGIMRVCTESSPNRENLTTCGRIVYIPSLESTIDSVSYPSCYQIDIRVPQATFDNLLASARLAQIPSIIMVEAQGAIEMDWQPDGSGMKWDNKAAPELTISSVTFIVPLLSESVSG